MQKNHSYTIDHLVARKTSLEQGALMLGTGAMEGACIQAGAKAA